MTGPAAATIESPHRRVRPGGPALLFLIVLLDLLGFGLVVPQLGVFGLELEGSPLQVALLLSVYSGMQFVAAPVLGRLSDRFGRRRVLLWSVAASVVGHLLFAFASSIHLLFAARVVCGAAGGSAALARASLADLTPPADRARAMGLLGTAFGLGFLVGPALGGLLGGWGGHLAVGLGAALLALLSALLVLTLLPSALPARPSIARPLADAARALEVPGVARILGLFLVFAVAFGLLEGTFAVHVASSLAGGDAGTAAARVGMLFAAVGLTSVVVQGLLIGPLRRRFGEGALAGAGMVLAALGIAALSSVERFEWAFLPVVVFSVGSSLVHPSMAALLSLRSPRERQGELLGAFQSMGALGRITGPALGGALYTQLAPAATYGTAAGLLALAAVGTLWLADS